MVPGVKVAYERHVAEGARDLVLMEEGAGGGLGEGRGWFGWFGGKGKGGRGEWEEVGGSGSRVGRARWGKRGEKVEWVG